MPSRFPISFKKIDEIIATIKGPFVPYINFLRNVVLKIKKNIDRSGSLFWLLTSLMGFVILSINTQEIFLDLLNLLGYILVIIGVLFAGREALKELFDIDLSLEKTKLLTSLVLSIFLIIQLVSYNLSPVTYILSLIFMMNLVQSIFYRIFYSRYSKDISKNPKYPKLLASITSYCLVVGFLFFIGNIFYYKIALFFCVYGFYDVLKIQYLDPSIESSEIKETIREQIGTKINSLNIWAFPILLLIFLLYNYQVLSIFDQQMLYYFYSTTAQVFAALLGIVVMFGILVLQRGEDKNDYKTSFLREGLVGFSILYTSIIILSLLGIVVASGNVEDPIIDLPAPFDTNVSGIVGYTVIFEITFLLIPLSLFYLYAMISDFLTLEPKSPKQMKMVDYGETNGRE